jgi:hypothetical protein
MNFFKADIIPNAHEQYPIPKEDSFEESPHKNHQNDLAHSQCRDASLDMGHRR